jgi:hypothetical protein
MTTSTPTYPQYTNLALNDGLFDQLMASVKYHLDGQYKAQRIRGDNYSKVYLGSMEAVMGNTTQYLLGVMLIEEKKEQLKLENELLELKKEELRFKIDFLYPLELQKLEQELLLIIAQVEKIGKEIEFITAKINTEIANVDGSGVTEDSVVGRQVVSSLRWPRCIMTMPVSSKQLWKSLALPRLMRILRLLCRWLWKQPKV